MAATRYLTISEIVQSDLAQTWNALKAFGCKMRVACPGIIQAFDPDEQTATVRLALRESILVDEVATNDQIPDLIHVPIVIPRAGGFALTLPIAAGDECLVVFGDMCIDSWWQSGGVQNQMKLRRHSLSDGFAIVGVWNQQRLISNYSTSSAQLRSEDGNTLVDLSATGISVKGQAVTVTGSESVTISGNGQTTIEGRDFLNHTHEGVQAGGGVTGPVV